MNGRPLRSVPDTFSPVPGLSEQGEAQHRAGFVWADPSTVDAYVATASDEVLECRSAGHSFPISRRRFHLDYFDANLELFVAKARCTCCRSAERTTWYRPVKVGRGGRGGWRFEEVAAELTGYRPNPDTGEVYTVAPGAGRMRRRDVRSAIATLALSDMTLPEVYRSVRAPQS